MEKLVPEFELPSLDSLDKNERSLARQLRFRERFEKSNLSDEDFPTEVAALNDFKVFGPKIICKARLDESRKNFGRCTKQRTEYLTNLSVVINTQRSNFIAASNCRIKEISDLGKRAKACEEEFRKITLQWSTRPDLKDNKNCLQLRNFIEEKTRECDKVLSEKNEIIILYRDKIKQRKKDLKTNWDSQGKAVAVVSQRINDVINSLYQLSQEELKFVQETLTREETKIMKMASRKLHQRFQFKEEKCAKDYEEEKTIESDNFKKLKARKIEGFHHIQPSRIKIAQEIHKLKLKLWITESSLLENYARLKYGRRILDFQIKENTVLKQVISHAKYTLTDRKLKLQHEQKKMHSTFTFRNKGDYDRKEVEKLRERKAREDGLHFRNIKVYENTLEHVRNETKQMLLKLLHMDKVISRELLEVPWKAPSLNFLEFEKNYTLPEESRLLSIFDRFINCPGPGISGQDSSDLDAPQRNIQLPEGTPNKSCFSLDMEAPIDVTRIMNFICDTLAFLLTEKHSEFVTKQCAEKNNFVISSNLLPIIGIKSVDQLKLFIACILDRSLTKQKEKVVITRRRIFQALEDWGKIHEKKIEANNIMENTLTQNEVENTIRINCQMLFPKEKELLWDKLCERTQKYIWVMIHRQKLQEKVRQETRKVKELIFLLGKKKTFKAEANF